MIQKENNQQKELDLKRTNQKESDELAAKEKSEENYLGKRK